MTNNGSIRISSRNHGGEGVGFSGLQPGEAEILESLAVGSSWVRKSEGGRLESRPCFKEPPPPSQDPKLPPKWLEERGPAPFLVMPTPSLPEEPDPKHHFPSLIIQSLLGYNGGDYEKEARKLQAYGFECLRSRRGCDGKLWELWFLPGLCLARGALKDALHGIVDTDKQINTAVNFLCDHVSFGTLDVAYQRAAMVMD